VPPSDARARLVVALALGLAVVVAGIGLSIALFSSGTDDDPVDPPAPFLARALAGAEPAVTPFTGLTELELMVGDDCLRLVVADMVQERTVGLRSRSELGPYDGMLFAWETEATSSFTMRGVPVPLDIGWYDESGAPVDRAELEPCPADADDCPSYSSRGPYRFALETLGGELPGGALSACPA
jgi:uncharacterized membrane protein (UPF0127 family)